MTKSINIKRMGREFAVQLLFQIKFNKEDSLERQLMLFWKQVKDSHLITKERELRKSREFAEKLMNGVLDNLDELDKLISDNSKNWKMNRIAPVEKAILRIASYEMKYIENIPIPVSINEAIDITKDFSSPKSSSFINGILNAIKESL